MNPGNEKYLSVEKVLMEDEMDTKVLQMWSKREISAGRFYQTGFETILFNQDKSFALETVLSSIIHWDKGLLVLNSGATDLNFNALALFFDIHNHNSHHLDFPAIEMLIRTQHSLSHVLLNLSDAEALTDSDLEQLLQLINRRKLTLIVNCDSEVDGLNDRFMGAIDFMIGKTHSQRSFVIARRSKLVQAEGNSRNLNNDLYAYWQWSVRHRNAVIEPMCG
ncbi:MAG: hypothetical protein LC643_04225, partial [Bacteroidales bacterium]|nr:hypothetical protein [Bacteroidales bacterium]